MFKVLYSVSPAENFFFPEHIFPPLVPEGKLHLTDNLLNADLCKFSFIFISEMIKIYNLQNWEL